MEFKLWEQETVEEIQRLFIKTFSDSEGITEGKLIGDLVEKLCHMTNSEDVKVFLAMDNTKVIGAIIFSRLRFESHKVHAYILSPVAVHPDYQGKGIGQQLINFGHAYLKERGVSVVVTYGDIKFYAKVGYQKISEEIIQAPLELSYPNGWLGQSLINEPLASIEGKTFCVEALNDSKYW